MTFREKLNLLFHRDECVKLIIFDEKKRAYSKIYRLAKEEDSITIGKVSFLIDVEKVYYLEGIPTLTYHITNPSPIDPTDAKSAKFDSKMLKKAFKTKIVGDMIEASEEEGLSLKNIIIMMGIITIIGLGIGLFMLFKEVQSMQQSIDEYNDVINLIKEYLLQNGGR